MKLKNEVARWAFETLKLYLGVLWPERPEGQIRLPGEIDHTETRYAAFARAVEVAGRLELAARAGVDVSNVDATRAAWGPSVAQVCADLDPMRLRTLTRAVNEFCSCGGNGPEDKDCCDVCRVWHYVNEEVATDDGKAE